MKNVTKSICMILTILMIVSAFHSLPVSAKDKVRIKAGTVFIDKGEEIITGVDFDKAYINNITVIRLSHRVRLIKKREHLLFGDLRKVGLRFLLTDIIR